MCNFYKLISLTKKCAEYKVAVCIYVNITEKQLYIIVIQERFKN
jgi:hypothetical protein